MVGALVEFLPQRLRLPRFELGLELRIKLYEICRFDVQQVAQVTKVAEDRLEGGGVTKLVEDLARQGDFR